MAPTPFHDPSPEIIASWPSPDLVNPPNRGPALLIIVSALIFFSLLSLALRIYSRVFFRRNFGLDDLLILPAAVSPPQPTRPHSRDQTLTCAMQVLFLCVGAITVVGNTQYGWGMHAWDVPIELREHGFLLAWVYEILVTWCLMLTKLSLCVFYLRLLGGAGSERSRALIFSLMAVIMLWGLVFTIAIVMQCTPISGVYRINMPGKRCLSRQGGLAAHTSVDIMLVSQILGGCMC